MTEQTNESVSVPIAQIPTVIEFVLDETSSMSIHLQSTIDGYNDYLDEQRQGNGLCLLTLTKFNNYSNTTPYVDIDINLVPALTKNTFLPTSMTNLFDTIVNRIDDLWKRLSEWEEQPKVLFVVMTDGEDNTSKKKIEDVFHHICIATKHGWTCVYLGANQNALNIATKLGFSEGNIKSFETTKMRETMQEISRATTAFRAGITSPNDFFSNSLTAA